MARSDEFFTDYTVLIGGSAGEFFYMHGALIILSYCNHSDSWERLAFCG
jgi:hypothetical protein